MGLPDAFENVTPVLLMLRPLPAEPPRRSAELSSNASEEEPACSVVRVSAFSLPTVLTVGEVPPPIKVETAPEPSFAPIVFVMIDCAPLEVDAEPNAFLIIPLPVFRPIELLTVPALLFPPCEL